MRLSKDTILSIAFGAVQIETLESGLRFYKCTKKQIDTWTKERQDLGERAAGCTGVRLDFHTDAQWIRFKAPYGKFELLVDDLTVAQFNAGEETEFYAELGEGEKRVLLLFPSHDVAGILEWVELPDGAHLTPHQYDRKLLFIGDSITQGWNSGFDSTSYAWRVTRKLNADSVINGIGGAYYLADSFDSIDFDPDTVIVAYGTNDYGHFSTQEELRNECAGFLDQIKDAYGERDVYCILPIYMFDPKGVRKMGTLEDCRRVIREEIEKREFNVIDGFKLVPHLEFFYADAVPQRHRLCRIREEIDRSFGKVKRLKKRCFRHLFFWSIYRAEHGSIYFLYGKFDMMASLGRSRYVCFANVKRSRPSGEGRR